MDLDHALRVFRLYCHSLKQGQSPVKSMLFTDKEKQAISELKSLIKEYYGLIEAERPALATRAN